MKLDKIVKQSVRALMANKGRTFLTTLGIIIGIGSVIGLISLGEGVQSSIADQIGELGGRNITIIPGGNAFGDPGQESESAGAGFSSTSTLTKADLDALNNLEDGSISTTTGLITSSEVFDIDGSKKRRTINGVSSAYFEMFDLKLNNGKLFDADQNNGEQKVVVLGDELAAEIFGSDDPVGETLTFNNEQYLVIGVLEHKDAGRFDNPNNQGYIPERSAMSTYKTDRLATIVVQASSEDMVDQAKTVINKTLLETHNVSDESLADFTVATAADLLATVNQILTLLTGFLAGIAAISLLVGGIGIMNIMLVAVTERTREIGLRKAVGAKTSDIMLQFIIESVLLTLIGGALGVAVGYGIGFIASQLAEGLKPVVTLNSLLLAIGVSSFIGILFGVYPAYKAARLNPIDALRYE